MLKIRESSNDNDRKDNILRIKGQFIVIPRILFRDKNLSKTDIDVLSLIISLALKDEYCYANNKYLADYINMSERTITDSLSKLKGLNYIFVKNEDRKRKIYLNTEKIPIVATDNAETCDEEVAKNCDHNIKNKNKKEYNNNYTNYNYSKVPYWMEHPEVCQKEEASPEEQTEMKELLKEFE